MPDRELVPERAEFFLDQEVEALESPKKRVDEQLGEGCHLGGAVPAIGAVDDDLVGSLALLGKKRVYEVIGCLGGVFEDCGD